MSKLSMWWDSRRRPSEPIYSDIEPSTNVSQSLLAPTQRSNYLIEQGYYPDTIENGSSQSIEREIVPYDRCTSILQALEGKTIRVTVLSIDMVNSTKKVETLSSEAAGQYYQAFIETTSDFIQNNGGYVLKNVGDCVIGFFPCSEYIVENHDKAVLCGLNMRDMIRDLLSPYLMKRRLPSITCRVSADFGAARVLRVRSNGGYSAIDLFGRPMNSASKISHYAKPNQMVIGDSLFWKLIDMDDFDFKAVTRFDLTGKHQYPVYLVERK